VHIGRLRAGSVLETAHQVRSVVAHVAQFAGRPSGDHRETVFQGDHRRHTHTATAGRHVPHGKVIYVNTKTAYETYNYSVISACIYVDDVSLYVCVLC